MEVKRGFKGIWIPKEIWLATDLSVIEKIFLVEIDSLDNEQGCFASNAHFADFFGISKGRCSQIIKGLEEKELITTEYLYEGKEIKRRTIKVVNKVSTGVVNKLKGGIKKTKGGYLENDEGSNTSLSNTSLVNNNKQSPEIPKIDVHQFYQENFTVESGFIIQDLEYWVQDLTAEVVILALQNALELDAPYKYAKTTMQNWAKKDIATVEAAKAEMAARKKRNQQNKGYSQNNQNNSEEASYGGVNY